MSLDSHQYERTPALVLGEIGLVQNLGRAGIPVIVGSEIRDNPSLHSRYTRGQVFFSDYRSPKFIEELCDFGRSLSQKAVLFSDDDHAILNIAKHQDQLEPYYLFSFPDPERVEKLLDKQLFCELIEQYDLPAPRSITLSSVKELNEKPVEKLQFPCVIKPSFKQAWWGKDFDSKVGDYQKAIKCKSYEELVNLYRDLAEINPHVVVQEFIEGGEDQIYSVNMCVSNEGRLDGYFIAQKLRTYPIVAGEGCYITTVEDPEMIEMTMDIVRLLELRGLLNIQFKRDQRTGKPVLLEIHTRNSVWSYLGTAAGANIAALYYQLLTGNKILEQRDYVPGVRFIFIEKDLKAFIQNLRVKQVPIGTWMRTYFQKFILGGFSWNDPMPAVMKLWFIMRRRLAK
ncbi:carboxylate--amine ligase [Fodinibius sp. AD559]|uniref:carboxylate--amine ligase n=1 Tax=Fodinibius sp. AD559 TaxID=3424179 RepID=UPI0040469A9D